MWRMVTRLDNAGLDPRSKQRQAKLGITQHQGNKRQLVHRTVSINVYTNLQYNVRIQLAVSLAIL
jgi:hypothetical protein